MEQKLPNKIQEIAPSTGTFKLEQNISDKNENQQELKRHKEPSSKFPNLVLFRSVLNDLPLLVSALIIGRIIIWFTFALRDSTGYFFGHDPFSLIVAFLAGGFGLMCLVIAFRRYNVRYLIADDGIKALRGIISNKQIDAKLEYYQIRGTEIHRSLFERLIGTGDLHVRGSTSNDTEVAFRGIYDPYRYQKVIQERYRIKVQNLKSTWIDSPVEVVQQVIPPQLAQ